MGKAYFVAANHIGVSFPDNTTLWNTLEGVMVDGQTVESWAEIPFREAGTFDDLRVYASANTTLVNSVVTVRKNSANTTLTVTYTSGQTGWKADTTNSFTTDSSDLLDCQVAVANDISGIKAIVIHTFNITFSPTDNTKCVSLCASSGQGFDIKGSGVVRYLVPGGGPETIYSVEESLNFLNTYTLSNLYAQIDTNNATHTVTIITRKNAGNGNQSIVYTASQTGGKEDTVNTDSIVSGDDINFRTTNSVAAAGTVCWLDCVVCKLTYTFTALHEFLRAAGTTSGSGFTSTHYNNVGGAVTSAGFFPSDSQSTICFDHSATNFQFDCSANTSSSATTISFAIDLVNTSLVSFAAAETGVKSSLITISLVDTDEVSFYIAQGGTGTFTAVSYSYIGFTGTSEWRAKSRVITSG